MSEEARYKILKLLEQNPDISQRELSKKLDVSLGKVNYCINALKEKGLVKARNFRNSSNKKSYLYVLTPKGIEEKAKITASFLKRKIDEHELLENEIAELRKEVIATKKSSR